MAYNKTTWVNGVTKVNQGNLNNLEDGTKTNDDKLVNTFSADINEYFGNTKLGDDFQDDSVWSSGAGTQSADTTNVKIGSQSLRITENDNTGNRLFSTFDNISLDFTLLNNSETSNDDDYISFVVFITDVNFVGDVRLDLGNDSTFNSANRRGLSVTSGLINGWNFLKLLKSDFDTAGTGDFSDIKSIRASWNSLANAQNEYVSFQLIQLVKKDPLTAIPNQFQRFGVRDFQINNGEWFIGKEFGDIVWKEIGGTQNVRNALQQDTSHINFITTGTIQPLNSSIRARYLTWFIDSNNFISLEITTSDILNLRLFEGGVSTDISIPFDIDSNDTIKFTFQKNDSNISAEAYKNNDLSTLKQLSGTTTLTNPGNLSVGRSADGIQNYSSFSITEISHAHHSDISETTRDSRITDLIQSHTNIEWLGGKW